MYNKPYLTVAAQLDLLKSRGMLVPDEDKAAEYLKRIGYYRLSAYWHPMRKRTPDVGLVCDDFVDGTSFKDVTDLYTFDGRLRLIMLDALERLEVSLRTEVALCLGLHEPQAHRKLEYFGQSFSQTRRNGGATKHREWVQRLDKRALESKDQFAEHFRTKYPSEDMPVWIAVELLDFGPLSHLIAGMTNRDLAGVGRDYGGIKPNYLKSWARSLAFTRNVCAHHSRLWNKPLVNQPKVGADLPAELLHLNDDPHSSKRVYSVACVAQYMLKFANPRTSWRKRFVDHILTFPNSERVSLRSAGFPQDWQHNNLWK